MFRWMMEVPAITADPAELFKENDEERQAVLLDELERQEKAQRSAWANIITAPGFVALKFVQRTEYPMTLILHPSSRQGIDWQLSRFGWENGEAYGHGDFYSSDLNALYKELMEYAYDGVTVEACYLPDRLSNAGSA